MNTFSTVVPRPDLEHDQALKRMQEFMQSFPADPISELMRTKGFDPETDFIVFPIAAEPQRAELNHRAVRFSPFVTGIVLTRARPEGT